MRTALGKRVERLEDRLSLSESGRAERAEELNELLRELEQYRNWLDDASGEELEAELKRLDEEHRKGVKYSEEEIALGLPRYEDVIFDSARKEVERAIRRKELMK